MAKIFLFGSGSIHGVPNDIIEWLTEYNRQGHEFIVGDKKGSDSAFHKALSSIGAKNVKIYSLNYVHNNTYDFPVRLFSTLYDETSKKVTITDSDNIIEPTIIENISKEQDIQFNEQCNSFRDTQLVKDCDIAICMWDGETKATVNIIRLLNIHNKNCYTFTMR